MELSIHITTDSPTDIASARAVLDFVERGISDPREPFVPVPTPAAPAPAPAADVAKPPRKTRVSPKARAKAAANGRSLDPAQQEIPGTEAAAPAPVAATTQSTPDFETADSAARAVHGKNGKVADVLNLLAPFKVTRVSELSKEQQPEFINAAKAFVGVA